MHWRGIRKKEKGGLKTHRSEKKRAEREGAFVFPIHLFKPKTEAERPVLGAQSSAARPHWAEVAVRGSCVVTSLRRRRAVPHPRAGSQLPAAHKRSGRLGALAGDVAGNPAPAARSALPGPWPLHRPVVGARWLLSPRTPFPSRRGSARPEAHGQRPEPISGPARPPRSGAQCEEPESAGTCCLGEA